MKLGQSEVQEALQVALNVLGVFLAAAEGRSNLEPRPSLAIGFLRFSLGFLRFSLGFLRFSLGFLRFS